MEKKYRLLKDTVDCKAGTIFEYKDSERLSSGYYSPDNEVYYLKKRVEKNSEWFEEYNEELEKRLTTLQKIHDILTMRIERPLLNIPAKKNEYEILQYRLIGHRDWLATLKDDGLYHFTGCPYPPIKDISNDNWKIYSVKRLSDGEVFTVGDIITHKSGKNQKTIESFILENESMRVLSKDSSIHTFNYMLQNVVKVQSNQLKEVDYMVLRYISKDKKQYTERKRGGDFHEQYWEIDTVKRLSDNETFTIGDIVQFQYQDSIKATHKIITGFLITEENDMRICCTEIENRYDTYHWLIKTVEKVKKQIGTTVKGEPIYKGDKVCFIHTNLSISPVNIVREIVGPIECFFTKEDAQEWINKNTFVTHDGVRVQNGKTIYGIATQASGRDKWREQVLPFPKTETSHRIWFSDKRVAYNWLLAHTPFFTLGQAIVLNDDEKQKLIEEHLKQFKP